MSHEKAILEYVEDTKCLHKNMLRLQRMFRELPFYKKMWIYARHGDKLVTLNSLMAASIGEALVYGQILSKELPLELPGFRETHIIVRHDRMSREACFAFISFSEFVGIDTKNSCYKPFDSSDASRVQE